MGFGCSERLCDTRGTDESSLWDLQSHGRWRDVSWGASDALIVDRCVCFVRVVRASVRAPWANFCTGQEALCDTACMPCALWQSAVTCVAHGVGAHEHVVGARGAPVCSACAVCYVP